MVVLEIRRLKVEIVRVERHIRDSSEPANLALFIRERKRYGDTRCRVNKLRARAFPRIKCYQAGLTSHSKRRVGERTRY